MSTESVCAGTTYVARSYVLRSYVATTYVATEEHRHERGVYVRHGTCTRTAPNCASREQADFPPVLDIHRIDQVSTLHAEAQDEAVCGQGCRGDP